MHTIGLLIFPDFQLLDAAGPIAVFDIAARECTPPSYRPRVIARTAGPVTSSSAVQLIAQPFSDDPLDTLIVAGGSGSREASACAETLAFIRTAATRARRIASVCTGAFILAAAGLLDGRRATTHWGRAAVLARAYPLVHVEPDRIFTRDGQVWTSAGSRPASTWHLRWSPMISASQSPNGWHSSLWSTTGDPAGSRNSRRCSRPIAPPVGFPRYWGGRASGWVSGFLSSGWRTTRR